MGMVAVRLIPAGPASTDINEGGNAPWGSLPCTMFQPHMNSGVVPLLSIIPAALSIKKPLAESMKAATSAILAELQETLGGCHLNSRTRVVITAGVKLTDRMVPASAIPSSCASRLVMRLVVPDAPGGIWTYFVHSTIVLETFLQ